MWFLQKRLVNIGKCNNQTKLVRFIQDTYLSSKAKTVHPNQSRSRKCPQTTAQNFFVVFFGRGKFQKVIQSLKIFLFVMPRFKFWSRSCVTVKIAALSRLPSEAEMSWTELWCLLACDFDLFKNGSSCCASVFDLPGLSFVRQGPQRRVHPSRAVSAQAPSAPLRLHRRRRRVCRMRHRESSERRPVGDRVAAGGRRWQPVLHWHPAGGWICSSEELWRQLGLQVRIDPYSSR